MNFWKRMFTGETKVSAGRSVLVMNQVGKPQSTPKNYEAFSREGYQANVIVYMCVNKIATSIGSIPWFLIGRDKKPIEKHPLLDLLKQPNPMQAQSGFMESVSAYFSISGNSYIEQVLVGKTPTELWPLRPDRMRVVPGPTGVPNAFIFGNSGQEKIFPVDVVKNRSDILHMKTFNPLDNWYGMSPIEAAMYSVDQHNESGKWNLSLLQNRATPSGAFTVKADSTNPLGSIPDTNFNNLQQQIREDIAGAQNAGRILILEGGLDWKEMGLSPKEMDWIEGRNMSARDIALSFNVPPILLHIPGDSTYSNVKEARLAFTQETILPRMDYFRDEFNRWLVPQFGDGLYLDYDKDSIPALEQARAERGVELNNITYLTINEKREQLGYEPVENGDILLVSPGLAPLEDLFVEEPTPEPVVNVPAASPEENDVSEDEPEDEEDDPQKDFHSMEIKQINVLTAKGKRRAWRQVNAARKRLAHGMYLDVKDELEAQSTKVSKSIQGVDQGLWEYAALKSIDDTEAAMKSVIEKHLKRGLLTFGNPILASGKSMPDFETKILSKFDQFVNAFIQKNTAKQVTEIQNTSKKKARAVIKKAIQDGLTDGDSERNISKQIKSELDAISDSRARTIARTEIGMASSNGALDAAKSLDVPDLEKEWVSDKRPFADLRDNPAVSDHQAMDGVTIGINEKFTVPPDADMDGPHDPTAGPEQIINCECALVFARGGKAFLPNIEEA